MRLAPAAARFGAAFLALAVRFVADPRAAGVPVVAFRAAVLLAAGFLAAGFLAAGFLAAGFFAAGFFAAGFFAAGFFAAGRFAAGRFAAGFFAAVFLAAGLFAAAFFAAGFLAAGFFAAAFFAAGFFTADFFAAGFLAADVFAAGFFTPDVLEAGLRAVFSESAKAPPEGAPSSPGRRIDSPLPRAIRFFFALMFAYKPCFAAMAVRSPAAGHESGWSRSWCPRGRRAAGRCAARVSDADSTRGPRQRTRTRIVPTPATDTVIVSPGTTAPTPSGVPV